MERGGGAEGGEAERARPLLKTSSCRATNGDAPAAVEEAGDARRHRTHLGSPPPRWGRGATGKLGKRPRTRAWQPTIYRTRAAGGGGRV